jgi:hypothetical protein
VTEHADFEKSEPAGVPRASRVRAIVAAALGVTATGVVIGGLWAWIAPPIRAVVAITHAGERVHDYLGTESDHFFDAPCVMLGLLTVLAVVGTVLVWQWREHRGPAMVLGLSLGMATAAAAAATTGALLVRLAYGALNFGGLCHPGAAGVLLPRAAAGGADPDVARRRRRAGVRRARGRRRPRRPGGTSGSRSAV